MPGRRSGRIISFPLVTVVLGDERYLVSMLGKRANWVRNLEAAGGNATLRHGRREDLRLEEVAVDRRAPVLKAYLKKAPGARPHVPVDKDAPLEAFEKVSDRFPVFRVAPRNAGTPNETLDRTRAGGLPASGAAACRGTAIFAVKLVHSAIFFSIAAGILQVFYAGVTNRGSRWTEFSLVLAVGESLEFAANGFRCPLTGLAENLAAESGQVTDIFLPRWFADRIPWIFTPPLIAGILTLIWHHWHPPAPRRGESLVTAINRKRRV